MGQIMTKYSLLISYKHNGVNKISYSTGIRLVLNVEGQKGAEAGPFLIPEN